VLAAPSCPNSVHTIFSDADNLIAVMVNHWFKKFAAKHNFPNDYTTLDIETSGFSPGRHLLCTYGYTIVRNRRPVETREVVLNWPDFGAQYGVDLDHLSDDLRAVEQAMTEKGQSMHHTWEYLKRGIDPGLALDQLINLIEAAEARNEMLVTHNGWRFDIEFIRAHFHDYLKVRFTFEPNSVFDTGAMEKASQIDIGAEALPRADESMRDFSLRIANAYAPGVYWALDRHCDQRYGLFAAAGLTKEQAHNAAADSLLLHHLFEAHRKLAEAVT